MQRDVKPERLLVGRDVHSSMLGHVAVLRLLALLFMQHAACLCGCGLCGCGLCGHLPGRLPGCLPSLLGRLFGMTAPKASVCMELLQLLVDTGELLASVDVACSFRLLHVLLCSLHLLFRLLRLLFRLLRLLRLLFRLLFRLLGVLSLGLVHAHQSNGRWWRRRVSYYWGRRYEWRIWRPLAAVAVVHNVRAPDLLLRTLLELLPMRLLGLRHDHVHASLLQLLPAVLAADSALQRAAAFGKCLLRLLPTLHRR